MDALERLISYIKIDTQSSEESGTHPSTEKQFDLARKLEAELRELGAKDVRLSDKCYVYARIPSNLTEAENAVTPVLGLISHMDTSPAASDTDVKPRLIEKYEGGDIVLGHGEVLSPKTFPQLDLAKGDALLVTDGSTLLGADDKAGVAEIMALVEYLHEHPEHRHGELCIGFTPDEEIGEGAKFFDVKGFGAEVAYTVDGGEIGGIEYENFNAASGTLHIKGVNVHPGSAKNKMVSAVMLGMEFQSLLPPCTPANTEGFEGFFHLCQMKGDESSAELRYIIREHDREKFEGMKKTFLAVAKQLNEKYAHTEAKLTAEVKDSYYNMKEKVEPYPYLIETAREAFRKNDITPSTVAIRGGTDGATLSYMGLPCPNISTGGENFHGIYEYLNVTDFYRMIEVLKTLVTEMIGKKTK